MRTKNPHQPLTLGFAIWRFDCCYWTLLLLFSFGGVLSIWALNTATSQSRKRCTLFSVVKC